MNRTLFAAMLAGAFAVAGASPAATLLYDQTLVPNSNANVTTFYDADNDFNESWDFSSVAYTSIDRFELTVVASGAANESFFGLYFEDWDIRVQGSLGGSSDDLFKNIANGSNSYVINLASDTGAINAFAHSVATGVFTLWLAEQSADSLVSNPSITVSSVNLKVYGEAAVVPLPASLPLLLAGLGGIALIRRRKVAA